MSQVQNNTLHNAIQPIALMAIAYIAGSKRFIHCFPGSSRGGLCLAVGLGVGGILASPHINNPAFLKTEDKEDAFHSFVRVATSLALGVIGAYGVTKLLKGRVSFCEHAAIRLIVLELLFAGVFTGISVCLIEEEEIQKTLEERHALYQKDPDAWNRLSEKERVAFAEECLAADKDLVVLPIKENGANEAFFVPQLEDFSSLNKNQIEWLTEMYRCGYLKLDIEKEFALNVARNTQSLAPVWVNVTQEHVKYALENGLQPLLECHEQILCQYFIENLFKVHQELLRMDDYQEPYLCLKAFVVCIREGVGALEKLVVLMGQDVHIQEIIRKFRGQIDHSLVHIKERIKEFSDEEQANLIRLVKTVELSLEEICGNSTL